MTQATITYGGNQPLDLFPSMEKLRRLPGRNKGRIRAESIQTSKIN
jgi:hypothetical protein